MNNIFDTLEKNKFSYEDIKNKSEIILLNDIEYDVNVIIGFKGRREFIDPIIESFQQAFLYYYKLSSPGELKNFCLTFVEHSPEQECRQFIQGRANYLWTPGNVSDQYSRSFAYNFGVKYSNKAKFYILHDIDILVKENFFEEVFLNLNNGKCMQTYGGRRVLYMSQQLTDNVINGKSINEFSENTEGVSLPMFNGQPALGSKGGSILVERDFFQEIGGFDPELFWGYAAEDQIFWDKALTILGEVQYADKPKIDIFHMWHMPTSSTNPLLYEMENYMLQFRAMKKKERFKFLELKKELLNNGK